MPCVEMTAEAMLGSKLPFIQRLTSGDNRSSRFTQVQAEQFASERRVVAHESHKESGFRGTLFGYLGETDAVLGETDAVRGLTKGRAGPDLHGR